MKNTLFIATYFNNAHFIEYQVKSFKTFIKDDYDFAVIDDSTAYTKSLLIGSSAKEEIKNECAKYNIKYIPVPQQIHCFVENGGLVTNDAPGISLDHPTERHQGLLRWILNSTKQLGFDQYKTLVILDADMFFKKPINISEYMAGYDVIGAGRQQKIDIASLDNDRRNKVSQELKNLDGQTIEFFTMCLLFINMQNVKNLTDLDNKSYRFYTDTGGKTHLFIKNNPQYKYLFLKDWNSAEYRCDFFSKEGPRDDNGSENNPEIIHYRGGSNWDYQTKEYYSEKLYRVFKHYIPEIVPAEILKSSIDVTSRSGEHTFKKE